ncbi:MAG: hypothetical protein E7F81_06185, partial [Cutibacterium avidum]|nr:hypothetical protein [Cutibacterium avidum]
RLLKVTRGQWAGQDERTIDASEPKGVTHDVVNWTLLATEIQISPYRVWHRSGMDELPGNLQATCHCLDQGGSAQGMANERLGCLQDRTVFKHAGHRLQFNGVAKRCSGGVKIDEVDCVRCQSSLL